MKFYSLESEPERRLNQLSVKDRFGYLMNNLHRELDMLCCTEMMEIIVQDIWRTPGGKAGL